MGIKRGTKTAWEGRPDSIESLAGFVYLITNNLTGKMYVGRKYFWRSLRKKVVGKLRRKKVVSESDWEFYKSSSKLVLSDIKEYGESAFSFRILSCWERRADVNEAEIAEQFARNVLHSTGASGEYLYYNESIMSKFYRPKSPGTPEYEAKCANISAGLKRHIQSGSYVHPLQGKVHPNRGKKLPQTRALTSVAGRLRWTDGTTNLLLRPNEVPPEGYRRGVAMKPRGTCRAQIEYEKNPSLCAVCEAPISFRKRKQTRHCSRACSLIGKPYPAWKNGTNPMQKYVYHTPAGTFLSAIEAGKALGCSNITVGNRCKRGVVGYWFELVSNRGVDQ